MLWRSEAGGKGGGLGGGGATGSVSHFCVLMSGILKYTHAAVMVGAVANYLSAWRQRFTPGL